MRVAVVSDIHANLLALEAVLADLPEVEAIWCLGDFVGYGPWPNECVELLRSRAVVAIAGNHDLAAIGAITIDDFNPVAARGTHWTTEHLSQETRGFLESLDPVMEVERITLAHGSPRHPVWEYITHEAVAAESFAFFNTSLCLVGHTHFPTVFLADDAGTVQGGYMHPGRVFDARGIRAIANPGSVGQPRDGDPRASYLVLDTALTSLEWRRVPYDIAAVQARILEVCLPSYNADRLAVGG